MEVMSTMTGSMLPFRESEDKKTSSGKIIKLKIIKHIESFRCLTYFTQANFEVRGLEL